MKEELFVKIGESKLWVLVRRESKHVVLREAFPSQIGITRRPTRITFEKDYQSAGRQPGRV